MTDLWSLLFKFYLHWVSTFRHKKICAEFEKGTLLSSHTARTTDESEEITDGSMKITERSTGNTFGSTGITDWPTLNTDGWMRITYGSTGNTDGSMRITDGWSRVTVGSKSNNSVLYEHSLFLYNLNFRNRIIRFTNPLPVFRTHNSLFTIFQGFYERNKKKFNFFLLLRKVNK